MNYRSFADLGKTVFANLYKIPRDVDLIVGIPRSGLLAGSLIALALNIPIIDLVGFIENRKLYIGRRVSRLSRLTYPKDAKHVLIVDDSICSGEAFSKAIRSINAAEIEQRYTSCAIYATPDSANKVDIFLDIIPIPRAFGWNIMYHPLIGECCVDIDGVLCVDPTQEENDDGVAYRNYLRNAHPLFLPTYVVGSLVTSRLEKYRSETEEWLKEHGVEYKRLYMLDLPDAETRRKLNAHAPFKAKIYKKHPTAQLFIESEPHQALEITRRTGRPVLCISNQQLYTPEVSLQVADAKLRSFGYRAIRKVARLIKRFIGY